MTEPRIDRVARWVAGTGTRRTVLRASAALVSTIAVGRQAPGFDVAAAEGPPPPPSEREYWPACSDERRHYCVAELRVDGVDQLNTTNPTYSLSAFRLRTSEGPEDTSTMRPLWILNRLEGGQERGLQDQDLGVEVELRLKLGQLHPILVIQTSGIASIQVSGNDADGWELVSRGVPALFSFPGDDEQSDSAWATYWGEGYQRAEWPAEFDSFRGTISASAISGYPTWEEGAWRVGLSAPHFLPDGSVRHGSYSAWVSPQTLTDLHLTLEEALSGGLSVTREDGGVTSSVNASLTARDGGVYIEIPDLTFSTPTIVMKKRAQPPAPDATSTGKCDPKCRKGRVCKNGRCKKKKKKNKRKH